MRIRMVTTAAGPSGVWPAGSEQVVDRETGETLVRYGFAELVDAGELVTLAGREVAITGSVVEQAVDPVTSEIPKSTSGARGGGRKSSAKKSSGGI